MRSLHLSALVVGLLAAPFANAAAQGHKLSGFVRDSLGHPLSDAALLLDAGPQQQSSRTDNLGHFVFDTTAKGRHRLSVLRIGYARVDRELNLPDADIEITITLHALASALDTMVVTSSRLGLYGNVVALHFPDPTAQTRDFLPLPAATVQVIGSHPATATTDTLGGFSFPNAKAGAYMLHVGRDGYISRNLAVTVPADSGVRLAVVLDSGHTDDRRIDNMIRDMRQRVAFRGMNSAFLSAGDLKPQAGESLEDALRTSTAFGRTAMVLDPGRTCVFVDGLPSTRPLSAIDATEVESVEVYGDRGDRTNTLRWPKGVPCGDGRQGVGNARVSTQEISIWLRR